MTSSTDPVTTLPASVPGLAGARVLVATDLSPASDEALVEADRFVRALGGSLLVLHVMPFSTQTNVLFPQNVERESLGIVQLQERISSALSERVAEKTGRSGEDVTLRIESGPVDATIVRVAEEVGAGLVVVGSHGAEGFGRRVLGSVADRVVRHAHCPVLVARWQAAKGKILAATDLSDPSYPAVEVAAQLASRSGAEVTVVHVVEGPDEGTSGRRWTGDEPWPAPSPQADARLDEATVNALSVFVARSGAGADLRVVSGTPAAAIVQMAEELPAELVVVGCHGRTGLKRLLLGSVAETVIRAAPCSVLAVRVGSSGPASP